MLIHKVENNEEEMIYYKTNLNNRFILLQIILQIPGLWERIPSKEEQWINDSRYLWMMQKSKLLICIFYVHV